MKLYKYISEGKISDLDMLTTFSEQEVNVIYRRIFPQVTKKELDYLKQYFMIFITDKSVRLPQTVEKFKKYVVEEVMYYFLDSLDIIKLDRKAEGFDFNDFIVYEGRKFDFYFNKLKAKIFTFYKLKLQKQKDLEAEMER